MFKDFKYYGQQMFLEDLNSASSGNMSVRLGKEILITGRGSHLGSLSNQDIIKVELGKKTKNDKFASSEIETHRVIYKNINTQAIIHAHPSFACTLSLVSQSIIPTDLEGSYYFKEVPIIISSYQPSAPELLRELPRAFKKNKIVIVKGHGTFAIGNSLKEAYQWISSLEKSCKILYLKMLLAKKS